MAGLQKAGLSSTMPASSHGSSVAAAAAAVPHKAAGLPPVVVYHDIFNLVCICVLNALNLYYLATGTGFLFFFYTTLGYFVVDLIYVAVVPHCVKSPLVILTHHIISAFYTLIPYRYPHLGWAMSYCMLVEINTWLLIAKRTIRSGILEAAFYISWVLLRNIWYPYLIYVFYLEWRKESQAVGSPYNAIVITPIFQVALTALNYYWTINLIKNQKRKLL